MLAICGAEAVFVVVGLVVRRAGVKAAVVTLLELDCMSARQFGLAEQLARFVETTLMVVADFRDDVARGVIADFVLPDFQGSWQGPGSYC